MSSSIHAHIRSNIVGYLALYVAFGGVAWAAGQVGPADIKDDAVRSYHIRDGQVKNADLAGTAVDASTVAPDSLGAAQIDESSLAKVPAATSADTASSVGPPEAWHTVAAPPDVTDACYNPDVTGVFCSEDDEFPWHNYKDGLDPQPATPAAFYKDRLGEVHLKGFVANRAITSQSVWRRRIFRLPPGYRPATPRVFPTVGFFFDDTSREHDTPIAVGRVDVQPNGEVQLVQVCRPPEPGTDLICTANGGAQVSPSTGQVYDFGGVTLDGISFRTDG